MGCTLHPDFPLLPGCALHSECAQLPRCALHPECALLPQWHQQGDQRYTHNIHAQHQYTCILAHESVMCHDYSSFSGTVAAALNWPLL